MAFGDPYLSVADFKLRANVVDARQDAAIEAVLKAASRQIDGVCGRRFDKTDAAEARVFTAQPRLSYLSIDDAVSVSEVAVDDGSRTYQTVFDAGDYELIAVSEFQRAGVYDRIECFSPAYLACGRNMMRVTAVWGWPEPPPAIVEACYLLANREKSLWTAPFGQTGTNEMGAGINMTAALTPLIKEMLAPFHVIAI